MPEIKHFPKRLVASVSEVGPWPESVQRGFGRLFAWAGMHHVQPIGPSLGIFYDDPAKVAADKLRSELCVPVAEGTKGSSEVQIKEVGGFEAATIVYQGEASITPAYNEVYAWLRAQGYHEAGAPLEVYLSMPGEEIRAEVVVPVTKFQAAPDKPVAVKKPAKKTAKPAVKKPAVKKAVKKPAKKAAAKKPVKKATKK